MPRGERRAGGRPPLKGKGNALERRIEIRVPATEVDGYRRLFYGIRDGEAVAFLADDNDRLLRDWLRAQAEAMQSRMAAGQFDTHWDELALVESLADVANAIDKAVQRQIKHEIEEFNAE